MLYKYSAIGFLIEQHTYSTQIYMVKSVMYVDVAETCNHDQMLYVYFVTTTSMCKLYINLRM